VINQMLDFGTEGIKDFLPCLCRIDLERYLAERTDPYGEVVCVAEPGVDLLDREVDFVDRIIPLRFPA
jgi:hypothetical protein